MSNILTCNIDKFGIITRTIDPGTISQSTTNEHTFSIEGLLAGDWIYVNKPTHTANVGIIGARVAGTNLVAIQFINRSGADVNPASESYTFFWVRPDATKTTANF